MITVWTMCTGDAFSPDEVRILKRQVDRHLSIPHKFVCITEHKIDGITTLDPPTDYPGWWGKIGLFKVDVPEARNLWLDLDVIITGSLDGLCLPQHSKAELRIAKNWAQSGHGGCQSSVMYWEWDAAQDIYNWFDPLNANWPPINKPGVLWGDQEHITDLRDRGLLDVEYFDTPDVISYKYHCKKGLPPDAKVVVFHGKPKPADVNDQWIIEARS